MASESEMSSRAIGGGEPSMIRYGYECTRIQALTNRPRVERARPLRRLQSIKGLTRISTSAHDHVLSVK